MKIRTGDFTGFVKLIRVFTVTAVVIAVLTAFFAACFVATAKAEANISGEMPKIAGETAIFNENTSAYYEFTVNF